MASNITLEQIWQFTIYGINAGAIYALVALGFVIIYQVTGHVNFAQGEFLMLGAMFTVWFNKIFGFETWLSGSLAIIATALVAVIFERICIAPAEKRKANPMTIVVITLGASIAIRGIALVVWGPDPYSLNVFTRGRIDFFGAIVLWQNIWQIGAMLVAGGLLWLFFTQTIIGRAMRACSINRYAARLMGISPMRMSMVAFAVSAAVAALGGIVIAPSSGAVWDMGIRLGFLGFVAAVLGGWTYGGAVAGGFVLGVTEQLAIGVTNRDWSRFQDAFAFILLLVVLLLRPQGLFAGRARQTARAGL
jgi:branched-chain amino acid transport system permease protein